MKVDDIHIGVSPITNRIYAGKVSKNGQTWELKKDVTNLVISAVMEHMDNNTMINYVCEKGELIWTRSEENEQRTSNQKKDTRNIR